MPWFMARRKVLLASLFVLVQYELALFSAMIAIAVLTHHLDQLAAQWLTVLITGAVIAAFIEHRYIERDKLSPFTAVAHKLASKFIRSNNNYL